MTPRARLWPRWLGNVTDPLSIPPDQSALQPGPENQEHFYLTVNRSMFTNVRTFPTSRR